MVKYYATVIAAIIYSPSIFAEILVTDKDVNAAAYASVCVAAMPGDRSYNGPAMTQSDTYIAPGAHLKIRIGGKEMKISPTSGGKVTGLSITERQIVEI